MKGFFGVIWTIGLMGLVLAGCGGGGGSGGSSSSSDSSSSVTTSDSAVGGFYAVTFTSVEDVEADATLAVSEDGEFIASEDPTGALDGLYIHGQLVVEGTNFLGTGQQIALPGRWFTLDSGLQVQSVLVSLIGTVTTDRRLIEGRFRVAGIAGEGTFRAEATDADVALYARDASLAAIAGRYQDVRTGLPLDISIDASGSISDNMADCTVSGQAAPIDDQYNLYEWTIAVSACPDFVEGDYEGFAALDELTGNPVLVTAGDNGIDAVFVYILDSI